MYQYPRSTFILTFWLLYSLYGQFLHFQNFVVDLNSSNEVGTTCSDESFAQMAGAMCVNVSRP